MATITVILGTILLSSLGDFARIPRADSDVGLNPIQIIENHGYPAESHHITTEDGYILTYHRIPHGIDDDGSAPRPAILLMHGLLSSSADYVDMGTDRSLGYALADLGYDVWLGNSRGNAWSRNHTTLDVTTDAEEFFDFSWHEIGYYDLPAAVDYILEVNGDDSLQYVGHSQGCTAFLVFTSTRPEYNSKIRLASLMAPPAVMEHESVFSLLVKLGKYVYDIEKLAIKYKIYELALPENARKLIGNLCLENSKLCTLALTLIDGADPTEFDPSKFPVLLTNAPSNAAIKQFAHYGQQIINGGFKQYDHGPEMNLEIYGTETPPEYDLSLITAPVAIYYGMNDGLVNYVDAQNLAKILPNVANEYQVPYTAFNHVDFIFAIHLAELLYPELLSVIQAY